MNYLYEKEPYRRPHIIGMVGQWLVLFMVMLCSLSLHAQMMAVPRPFMTQPIYKAYLRMHFDYPEQDLRNKHQGKFILHFVTDKRGRVVLKNILSSVSPAADSVALDVFNKILWLPAVYNGQPVKGEANFVMKFKIKKFEKLAEKRGYRHINLPYLPVDKSYRIYKLTEVDLLPEASVVPYHSLDEFILSELSYPQEALKQGLQGTVRLSFVIEVNGLPSNIHVIESVGGGCTEEAVAMVEKIRWMPAIKEGAAVRSLKVLPVVFNLKRKYGTPYIPSQNNRGLTD